VFNIDEIIYAKADHVYTIFVTISEKYLFRLSLKKILEQLPEDIFAQVNRSVVINKSFIQKMTSNSVTVNEKVFKISPIFKENFI
jgi:DNA-binding LytR/AlgR family response regulator